MVAEASTLLLRLAGVTQAWHAAKTRPDVGRRGQRPKALEYWQAGPGPRGVRGLLGAALGRRRWADMSDLEELTIVVRIDQPGRPRLEFTMSPRVNSTKGRITVPTYHRVIDDAVYVVGVEGPRPTLEAAEAALHAPVFPLYLGRREYPPSRPISMGLADGPAVEVLREVPWQAAGWYQREFGGLFADLYIPPPEVQMWPALEVLPGVSFGGALPHDPLAWL